MLNDTNPNVLNRFRNIFAMLVLMVCVSGITMAQSVLSDLMQFSLMEPAFGPRRTAPFPNSLFAKECRDF